MNSRSKFYLNFFFNRYNKGITEQNKKQKKKHDNFLMFAKSKLNSIETIVSQALIDIEISHKKIIAILKETDKYGKMKKKMQRM